MIKKIICFLFGLGLLSSAFAEPDLKALFKNQDACFLLYNLKEHRFLIKYNEPRCNMPVSPDSTFKIPLSLIAFDSKRITQKTIFKWDGKQYNYPHWSQDQTPQTWLEYSVVWVSQILTPELGMTKIKNYLKAFDYGNQDFSGGLTEAWLQSSLKISPNEQLTFLEKLIQNELPVSKEALEDTKNNLYRETSPNGWKLYGKTGAGTVSENHALENSWFVGWVEKGDEKDIFVMNTLAPANTNSPGAPKLMALFHRAASTKNAVKDVLEKEGVF